MEKIERAKKKKVYCDVCLKIVKSERFNAIQIWDCDRVDKFFHESYTNLSKELIVCNDCIINLNFREFNKNATKKNM